MLAAVFPNSLRKGLLKRRTRDLMTLVAKSSCRVRASRAGNLGPEPRVPARAEPIGGDPVAYQERQTERHGLGGWSRIRWLVLTAVVIAIAVGIVLIVLYSGGGGGGGY